MMVHDDDAGVSGETCRAAVPVPEGWLICGAPATAVYRYACVHEHVKVRPNCPDHEPVPGQVGCTHCFKAGHECPLVFIPVKRPEVPA